MNKLYGILICFFIFINCAGVSFFEEVKRENLKSFRDSWYDDWYEEDDEGVFLKKIFRKELNLDPFKRRELAFDILKIFEWEEKKEKAFLVPEKKNIFDEETRFGLNLLNGPTSNPMVSLFYQIDRSKTELGRSVLASMLFNPIEDVKVLITRQEIIKYLANDELLFDKLEKLFDVFKELEEYENLSLSFWMDDDYFKSLGMGKKWPMEFDFLKGGDDVLNKSVLGLEIYDRFEDFLHAGFLLASVIGVPIYSISALCSLFGYSEASIALENFAQNHFCVTTGVTALTPFGFLTAGRSHVGGNRFIHMFSNFAAIAVYAGMIFPRGKNFFNSSKMFFNVAKRKIKAMGKFINLAKEIYELILKNKFLANRFGMIRGFGFFAIQELDSFFDSFVNEEWFLVEMLRGLHFSDSEVWKALLDNNVSNLWDWIFEEEDILNNSWKSWLWGWISWAVTVRGKVLKIFHSIYERKNVLSRIFAAVGEVDAYMSLARLYKEGQINKNKWSFAEYTDGRAAIELEEFWNPFLNIKTAVPSSIKMGIDENPASMIITGPNAGGKSTAVKAILINILLAQTVGLVPAKNFRLTPFSKVLSYLNIVDDIVDAKSHFEAGVYRANEIIEIVKNVQAEGGCVFVALDELFNGTGFYEGQAASYSLMDLLANQNNTLSVSVTHYPLLTKLAEDYSGKVKNYKVVVSVDGGNIDYSYKLFDGPSDQNIAFDILRERGFGEEFMNKAMDVFEKSQQG